MLTSLVFLIQKSVIFWINYFALYVQTLWKSDPLLSELAIQLELTKKELLSFIVGEMPQEEYESILRIKGFILHCTQNNIF